MQWYGDLLRRNGYSVRHESSNPGLTTQRVIQSLVQDGVTDVFVADPSDYLLERRLHRAIKASGIQLHILASPGFLCTTDYVHEWFDHHRYFLTDFYVALRRRWDVLMDGDKPQGGKWTFDTENRKRLPRQSSVPPAPVFASCKWRAAAATYVEQNFGTNPGEITPSPFPINFAEARQLLRDFLSHRLTQFGTYQDAIAIDQSWLFHSWLAPALNMGLITPEEVVSETIAFASHTLVPLNALEGFIRQIIGWREFVRAVYLREGVRQRTTNHWNHQRPIPAAFWTGNTGIPPLDAVIHRVLKTGYCNHIERLMILGNFMLLCRFNPDEVYRWFMTLFADAYDWVMVPNVYGMCQYADGGLMTTKPYVSGSNYVLKMSHFERGEWCGIWDGLYWSFIDDHRDEFARNPRMSMMVRQLERQQPAKLAAHRKVAEDFLTQLK